MKRQVSGKYAAQIAFRALAGPARDPGHNLSCKIRVHHFAGVDDRECPLRFRFDASVPAIWEFAAALFDRLVQVSQYPGLVLLRTVLGRGLPMPPSTHRRCDTGHERLGVIHTPGVVVVHQMVDIESTQLRQPLDRSLQGRGLE